MPDFEGSQLLTLRPGDAAVPVRFMFAAASTMTANDGSLPYGTTINSAVVKILTDLGSTSASVLDTGSVSVEGGLVVAARLSHPSATAVPGSKMYTALVALTLSSSAVINYDCARIIIDGARG